MPILPILTFPNSLLRKKAKPVKIIDDELNDLIFNMTETLKHAQGVGLAANQVGVLKRLCIIKAGPEDNYNAYINPEIIKKTVSSRVYFSKLEDWEIKSYVDTNEPLYCAGGFALEGIGGKYIEKIEGCFSNVMGLSLPWLRENLYR